MTIPIAYIGPGWPADWFEDTIAEACATFSLADLGPIIAEYCDDEKKSARHWPWIAFALANYVRSQQRGRDSNELSPDETGALLGAIAQHARDLDDALQRLDKAKDATLRNGNTPKWLATARAKVRLIDAFADPHYDPSLSDPNARPDFIQWQLVLYDLACRADDARLIFSQDDAAKAGGGQRLLGLSGLVSVCGAVWFGLTAKKPSAERNKLGGGNPPFVRFVIRLCEFAGLPSPTISQVKVALKSGVPKPSKPRFHFEWPRFNIKIRRTPPGTTHH